MKTSTSGPKCWPANARLEPHWPAPVSMVSRFVPSSALKYACTMAVLGLCEPVGETPSYLKDSFAGVPSAFSRGLVRLLITRRA
jgi:hypothetical protein